MLDWNRKIFTTIFVLAALLIVVRVSYVYTSKVDSSLGGENDVTQADLLSVGFDDLSIDLKNSTDFKVGGEYEISWSSSCQAPWVEVWLITQARSDGSETIVPLSPFLWGGENIFSMRQVINTGSSKINIPENVNVIQDSYNEESGQMEKVSLLLSRSSDGNYKAEITDDFKVELEPANYQIRVVLKSSKPGGCNASGVVDVVVSK